jgi:hypothetical protein
MTKREGKLDQANCKVLWIGRTSDSPAQLDRK